MYLQPKLHKKANLSYHFSGWIRYPAFIVLLFFQTSIESTLRGRSEEDTIQTVVVVAHYDAHAAAPGESERSPRFSRAWFFVRPLNIRMQLFSILSYNEEQLPYPSQVFLLLRPCRTGSKSTKFYLEDNKPLSLWCMV